MIIKSFAALQPSLKVEPYEYEQANPTEHEVLVQVTHCSVGRGDVYFLENKYGLSRDRFPLVAGHECVGVIAQLGTSVKDFKVGDRVGVGYQVWSCGECQYCQSNREQLCQKQKCLVITEPGAFASHIMADERFIFKVPSQISSETAAPLFCSGLTAYSAIRQANVLPDMRVGVVGIGGLGHLAVQLLQSKAAAVTAFSSKHGESAEQIIKMGASQVLPYTSNKAEPGTFSRIFVFTHTPIDIDYYLKLLKPDGELWLVGVDINSSTFTSTLLNDFANRSIHGSYIGSPEEMKELLNYASDHKVISHVRTYPMTELNEALQVVVKGKDHFRIVVTS